MERQSQGIVTDRLELARTDELGRMGDAFDAFNHKLEHYLVRWRNELARGELDVDVPEQSGDDMIAPAVRRWSSSRRPRPAISRPVPTPAVCRAPTPTSCRG